MALILNYAWVKSIYSSHVKSKIPQEKFYILTHPQYNLVIGKRVKDMIEGVNPSAEFFLKNQS